MSIKKAIVITRSTAVVTSIAFAQGPNTLEGALDGDKIFIASDGETFVGKVAPRYFRPAAEFPIEQVATHEANQLLSQEWRLIQY